MIPLTYPSLHADDIFSNSAGNFSFGAGIEKEVLFMVWDQFLQSRSRFFVEREEGFCTIKCMTSFAGLSISPARRVEMKRLGAVAALLYIHGQTPKPLSPAVILFLIYSLDLRCLTPGFIGEWFVELRKVLTDWLEMGPEGDPQRFAFHFATYHDTEVSR